MRHIQARIVVRSQGKRPRGFIYRGRTYRVERILDAFVARSRWWGREEVRVYYVCTTNRGVVRLYRTGRETWILDTWLD